MRLKPQDTKHQRNAKPLPLSSTIKGCPTAHTNQPLAPAYLTLIQSAHETKDLRILRLPDSAKKMGRANSTFWQDVKNGIAPPPIRLGKRSVGWLAVELDAILEARALASRTNTPIAIQLFVSQLVRPRQQSNESAT